MAWQDQGLQRECGEAGSVLRTTPTHFVNESENGFEIDQTPEGANYTIVPESFDLAALVRWGDCR